MIGVPPMLEGLMVPIGGLAWMTSVLLAVVLVSCSGLATAAICRRWSAPLRRGMLTATLGVLLAAPAVSIVASRAGLGWGWSAGGGRSHDLRSHTTASAVGTGSAAETASSIGEAHAGGDASTMTPSRSSRPRHATNVPHGSPTWQIAGSILGWIWATGCLAGIIRVAVGLARLRSLHRSLLPSRDAAAIALLATAARSVGLRRPPRLAESALVPAPVVVTGLQPVVVLPAGMSRAISREPLAAIFLHESAHLLHGDLWAGWVQQATTIAYWWCPQVHAIGRLLADLRERICDDHVVQVQGDGHRLAEAIVESAARLHAAMQPARVGFGTIGILEDHGGLEHRLRRLLHPHRRRPMTHMDRRAMLGTLLFAVAATGLVAVTTVRADAPPPKLFDLGEDARLVDDALAWIVRHQDPDGGWTFRVAGKPDAPPHGLANRQAATAMALLPLLGRGHTHLHGPYQEAIRQGLDFLGDAIRAKRGQAEGSLYTQGLVTMALCRGYGLSRDVTLAEPAQLAIDFIAAAQDPVGGGWRYTPKQPGDTSVLGWQFQALADGAAAGLKVKPEVVKKAVAFLDAVQGDDSGTTYGYVPGSKGGKATTAIGLFVRSRTGWSVGDKRLLAGNKKLVEIGPTKDLYFDYYATHSLHASEDPAAAGWRKAMREMLAKTQATEGDDRGSWYDGVQDGAGVPLAGRLYCTSLAAMILEVTAVPTADLGGLANDRFAAHLPR